MNTGYYRENDIIGNLTLIEPTQKRIHNNVIWICKCKCGNIIEKSTSYLGDKKTKKQCKECSLKSQKEKMNTIGGLSVKYPRLYSIASNAYKRCNDKKSSSYKYYGERGIKFEFNSIEHFINWSLENGYSDKLTIERKDVNGNYSPFNCCWITKEEQAKNKTITPELHGYKTYKEIAKYLGITRKALEAMVYKKKLTLEEIYELSKTDPTFHMSLYEKTSIKAMNRKNEWKLNKEQVEEIINRLNNGEKKTPLSKEYGVDFNTLVKSINRYNKGYY